MKMKSRPFRNRILISLLTALSFVAMSLSGIAVFIAPQRNVAYWTNWTFLEISKTQWGNIHIITSALFLIAGICHIFCNWTSLVQYLRGIPGRMTAGWRELIIAVLVTAVFSIGAAKRTPPFNYILNLNAWVKESWVKTPSEDPPFSNAELLSLKDFCNKMFIDTEKALRELRQAGLTVIDENSTIKQIARTNRVTPANVYQIIKKLESPDASQPAAVVVPGAIPPAEHRPQS
jgi:hypothetical protein